MSRKKVNERIARAKRSVLPDDLNPKKYTVGGILMNSPQSAIIGIIEKEAVYQDTDVVVVHRPMLGTVTENQTFSVVELPSLGKFLRFTNEDANSGTVDYDDDQAETYFEEVGVLGDIIQEVNSA